MSDSITSSLAETALTPQSVSADGVNVANRPIGELIEAAKYLNANTALDGISAGTHFMTQVRMVPPGAGGRNADC